MIEAIIDLDPYRVAGAVLAICASLAMIPAIGWYAALRPGGGLTETAHRRGRLVYTGSGRTRYSQVASHRDRRA